jgi:hypothetical protein
MEFPFNTKEYTMIQPTSLVFDNKIDYMIDANKTEFISQTNKNNINTFQHCSSELRLSETKTRINKIPCIVSGCEGFVKLWVDEYCSECAKNRVIYLKKVCALRVGINPFNENPFNENSFDEDPFQDYKKKSCFDFFNIVWNYIKDVKKVKSKKSNTFLYYEYFPGSTVT